MYRLLVLSSLLAPASAWALCPVADGDLGGADLILADGDCIEGVYTNVGDFLVPFGANVASNGAVEVYAITAVIDGNLSGSAAGANGGNGASLSLDDSTGGSGPGGGGGGDYGPCVHGGGGGGGGYGGKGGFGPTFNGIAFYAAGGSNYGVGGAPVGPGSVGSGGGGAGSGCSDPGADGGSGGGSVHIEATDISVNGGVYMNGGNGGNISDYSGGSGGGSGGSITLIGGTVSGVGTVRAQGGNGGDTVPGVGGIAGGGGGGGGGRIGVVGGGGTLAYSVGGGTGGDSQIIVGLLEDNGRPGEGGSVYHEGGPTLVIGGSCPGPVTMDVTGLTPFGTYLLIGGLAAGTTPIPSGACVGDTSGLGPTVKAIRTAAADAAGELHMTPNLAAGPCGKWMQIVDETTCTLTNPAIVP